MYRKFQIAADVLIFPLLSIVLIVTTAAAQMEDTNDMSRVLDNSEELKHPMYNEITRFADSYKERSPDDTGILKTLLQSLKMTKHQNPEQLQDNDNPLVEKEKRPFCNGFHGCGIIKGKRPAGLLLRSIQPIPEIQDDRLKRPFCNGFFGCGNGKRSRKLLLNLSPLRPSENDLLGPGLYLAEVVDLPYPFLQAASFGNPKQPVSFCIGNLQYHRPYPDEEAYIASSMSCMPAEKQLKDLVEIIKTFTMQGNDVYGHRNQESNKKEKISPRSVFKDETFSADLDPKAADGLEIDQSAISSRHDIRDTSEIRYQGAMDGVSSAENSFGIKKIFKRLIFCPDEGCKNKRVYMLPSHIGRKRAKRELNAGNRETLTVDADGIGKVWEGRLYRYGDEEGIDVVQYVMKDGRVKFCSANDVCLEGDLTGKEVQPNSKTYFYCGKKYGCSSGKISICLGGDKVGNNIFRRLYASSQECDLKTDKEKRLVTSVYGYANAKKPKVKGEKAKKYMQGW
ncbi:hypothetical protein ACJMK2_004942 [Sinanodonta woodiana]|uniref:Uncharacterized protein n=1 Tax=Sinanodonta woodiana TaxID=1069815 RepID=A0ABD3VNJ7_SINWO